MSCLTHTSTRQHTHSLFIIVPFPTTSTLRLLFLHTLNAISPYYSIILLDVISSCNMFGRQNGILLWRRKNVHWMKFIPKKSWPTCYGKLKNLPGDLWKHVLQVLDEQKPLSCRAEHLADLLHQLHRPRHVIAVLLTHLRTKPCKTEYWTNRPFELTYVVIALVTEIVLIHQDHFNEVGQFQGSGIVNALPDWWKRENT